MYTNRNINSKAIIITILLCSFLQFCIWTIEGQFKTVISEAKVQDNGQTVNDYIEANKDKKGEDEVKEKIIHENLQTELNYWKVEIPKIDLIASISEGTTSDILAKSVGHFEETSRLDGNIGLAAHNRGYNMNFFENIKNLDIGDKIIYTYEGMRIEYEVEKLVIIKETDWSYLEPTNENRVTLITCVKDSPEYRLCVQGKEVTK